MEKRALAELLNKELTIGYVYGYDGGRQVYYFEQSPSNIASFIMLKKEHADKIILTDTLDRMILDTYGEFINRCPDQKFLQEITKELVPMQLGEKEPMAISIATEEEAQAFWNQQEQQNAWVYCRIDSPEDSHGSLKSQKKELYDYAEQMGLKVAGCSEDLGSDSFCNYAGLSQAMKGAAEGKMDILLIKKLDRLGRDTAKTLELLQGLDQLGVQIYSPLEGEIRIDYQSPSLSMQ
jgi:hypothetical protein